MTGLMQKQNDSRQSDAARDEGPKSGPRSGRPRLSTDRVRSSEVTETVTRAENGVGSSSRRLRERSQTNTSRGGSPADGPKGAASRGSHVDGPKAVRAGAGSRGSGSRRSSPRSARESTSTRVRPAFDAAALVKAQTPNEDANPYQLLHPTNHPTTVTTTPPITTHFQTASLEELFGCGISKRFTGDAQFRNELRDAMRYDVFHSTPSYATLGEKAMQMMLHTDSSLQGSWFCGSAPDNEMTRLEQESLTQEAILMDSNPTPNTGHIPRMTRLTKVLSTHLGRHALSDDKFLTTIGALYGLHPSRHWIDVIMIQNK